MGSRMVSFEELLWILKGLVSSFSLFNFSISEYVVCAKTRKPPIKSTSVCWSHFIHTLRFFLWPFRVRRWHGGNVRPPASAAPEDVWDGGLSLDQNCRCTVCPRFWIVRLIRMECIGTWIYSCIFMYDMNWITKRFPASSNQINIASRNGLMPAKNNILQQVKF